MEGDAGTGGSGSPRRDAGLRNRPGSSLARTATGFIIIIIFPKKTKIGLPKKKKKREINFHRAVSCSELCSCGKAALAAGSGAGAAGMRRASCPSHGGHPGLGHRARRARGIPSVEQSGWAARHCRRIPAPAGRALRPPHAAVAAAGARRPAAEGLPRAPGARCAERGSPCGVGARGAHGARGEQRRGRAVPGPPPPLRGNFPPGRPRRGGAMLMREVRPRPSGRYAGAHWRRPRGGGAVTRCK